MGKLLLIAMGVLVSFSASAKVKTEVVEYKQDGTTLEGYLAYDSAIKGKRPVILIIHEWTGLTPLQIPRQARISPRARLTTPWRIAGL